MRSAIILLFIPLFVLHAQRYTAAERTILTLQDQRSLGNGKLVGYLRDGNAELRSRAAIALGNIQDTTTLSDLIPLLKDRSERVRASAAWALGQLGHSQAQNALLERLKEEENISVVRRCIEALGKCGTDSALTALVTFSGFPTFDRLRGEIALSVGRFAIRGIKSEAGIEYCFRQLRHSDAGVRWRALYALWRAAPHPRIEHELSRRTKEMRAIVSDKSAEVRIHFATLLGRSQSPRAFELLESLSKRERGGEWRVQVQIARALGTWATKEEKAVRVLSDWLDIKNDHVRIASSQGLRGVKSEHLKGKIRSDLKKRVLSFAQGKSSRETSVRGEAIVTIAKLFPDDYDFTDVLEKSSTSVRLKAKVLEGFGLIPSSQSLRILLGHTEDDSGAVVRTAWETLPKLFQQQNLVRLQMEDTSLTGLPEVMFRKMKASLLRDDMAITTTVAQAVGDSAIYTLLESGDQHNQAIEELMLSYTRLSSPNDVEAMHAILEALGKFGGKKAVPVLERALTDADRTVVQRALAALKQVTGKEYTLPTTARAGTTYTDYDWKTLEALPNAQRVRIRTNKGSFVVQLLPEHAPFSVLSFLKLTRKEFYGGSIFHRVVPNFVIQGGDPRGDGWGGPGYSIRSEWSLVNYERGSVGLASAGKDTEGCQFFVTHSPQPHLDGRYTIFARIVSGQEVVDAIQVGDKIVKVELIR